MTKLIIATLPILLFCSCCTIRTPALAHRTVVLEIKEEMPTGRSLDTYFADFHSPQSLQQFYDLSENEIEILKALASNGDRIAGARLYNYYKHTCSNPVLAEEALESVPRGNGIGEYHLQAFISVFPSSNIDGIPISFEYNRAYLQKKQVVELVSLAASGNREAGQRVCEYYKYGGRNPNLYEIFKKFAQGDNSVLPEIKLLDETFQKGDLSLVRRDLALERREFLDQLFQTMPR